MTDAQTTIADIRQLVRQFVDERNWQQFHTPKNLSMALAIEAAELMEHFQWISPEASREVQDDPDRLQPVVEEVADVLCYVVALANELDIDLSEAMRNKMKKNIIKYPAAEYRGRFGPEDKGPSDDDA